MYGSLLYIFLTKLAVAFFSGHFFLVWKVTKSVMENLDKFKFEMFDGDPETVI